MRLMYIAPRFHTNQAPIVKALIQHGHEVCFISQYRGKIEDYSALKPVVVGYSKAFILWEKIYKNVLHRNNALAGDMRLRFGIPPIARLKQQIKEYKPDVIILRERSIYSIVTYMSCKCMKIPFILYNQSPIWEEHPKNDMMHKIVKSMLPKVRMTPVMGNPGEGEKAENSVFVPFVVEPQYKAEQKAWFKNDNIHILCIGKYEQRKNIHMFIDVFSELQKKYKLKLTIAGECSTKFHKEYFDKQLSYVNELGQNDNVELLQNLSMKEISNMYKLTDLFILPSTGEPASISQMEAMSYSIPVICSDKNGTACYVSDGLNGYLFNDNDQVDLKRKIELMISDKSNMKLMGNRAYTYIRDECNYQKYIDGIRKCVDIS